MSARLEIVGVLAVGLAVGASAEPFLRVPKLPAQPVFAPDHRVAFEWLQASAFCGLRNALSANCGEEAAYVGNGFDASWWLGYDDRCLYAACFVRLPEAEGLDFIARTTAPNDINILQDDHLELQISFENPEEAAGKPFFKLMVNPNGALYAATIEALPGQDLLRDPSRILFAHTVTSEAHAPGRWWVARLGIPLDMLGVGHLDGREARLHLAYQTGFYYGSWGGVGWKGWNGMGRVVFDPAPPATLRLNGSFPRLLDRRGMLGLEAKGCYRTGAAESPMTVRLTARVEAGGATLYGKSVESKGVGGETFALAIQDAFTPRDSGNVLHVEAVALTGAGEETLLLRNTLPFDKSDPRLEEQTAEWKKEHRRTATAAVEYDYVYAPYTDQLDAWVNTRMNLALLQGAERARGEAMQAADELRVTVVNAAGETVARGSGRVADHHGHVVLAFEPPLAEGSYTVRYELWNAGQRVDTHERTLERRRFAWEKNRIGRERVVIPPWEPLRRSGRSLRMWGREYVIGDHGLPAAMVSQGRDVLGGAIRLQEKIGGRWATAAPGGAAAWRRWLGVGQPRIALIAGRCFPAEYAQFEMVKGACPPPVLTATDGYAAQVQADSELGGLPIRVAAELLYDGFYRVTLRLLPAQPTRVESLRLTIPLAQDAVLMRFSRQYNLAGTGAIPEGEGVLFESNAMPPVPGVHNSFVPIVFVGTHDRGLFWMAESDRGWAPDDQASLIQLVREEGQLELRFHLVGKPVTLDQPRAIEFALLATPSRPKPPGYRRALWTDGVYSHDTSGYRYYGAGVNGFQLYTDEDYEGLRKFFYERGGVSPLYPEGQTPETMKGRTYRVRTEAAINGGPLIVYGSTFGANAAMEEFPTFGSAWIQSAGLSRRARVDGTFRNRLNMGGTRQWTSDEQLTPVFTTMDDSFIDCHLWHMTRIADRCGINGTFYDNYQTYTTDRLPTVTDITGVAYRREDGALQPLANPLRRHEWTRRWATALWMMNRPPMQLMSNDPDNTYGPTWYVEGLVYHQSPVKDWIEQGMTLDRFAAFTASSSGMGLLATHIPPLLRDGRPTGVEERLVRLALAFALLHDLAPNLQRISGDGRSKLPEAIRRALLDDVEFAREGARWIRYWDNAEALALGDSRLIAGGYVHPEGKCGLLIVLNPTESPIAASLVAKTELLGRAVSEFIEADTGVAVATGATAALEVPRHGVRYLIVR